MLTSAKNAWKKKYSSIAKFKNHKTYFSYTVLYRNEITRFLQSWPVDWPVLFLHNTTFYEIKSELCVTLFSNKI